MARPGPGVAGIGIWLAAVGLVVNVSQGLFDAAAAGAVGIWLPRLAATALLVVAAQQGWLHRALIAAVLPDLRFGVATLCALALSTAAGTLVLQTPSSEVFYVRYGRGAEMMAWLHLHDVFGSWWFAWILAALAAGLLASVLRRRLWRVERIGFLGLHAGLLLLLAGGAVGSVWGTEGMIHLQTGESADAYVAAGGRSLPLPFELALDDFTIDRRVPSFALYAMEEREDGFVATRSFDASVPGVHTIPGFGEVEILRFYPPRPVEVEATAAADVPTFERLRMRAGGSRPPTPVSLTHPAVELRVAGPSGPRRLSLGGEDPAVAPIDGDQRALRLAARSDDIINFVATLGVVHGGERVLTQAVSVNRPLRYGGFALYQANFDPNNPRYSGILAVRDPGMPLVNLGLVAILLGITHLGAVSSRGRARGPARVRA